MATHSTPLVELHHGDRISRDEFLWRWEQLPGLKFAELIDGEVYLSSPLSEIHSDYETLLLEWLMQYRNSVPGLKILHNATWLLGDSSPQPDLALIKLAGSSHNSGKFREGPPELAVEIAYSSRAADLGPKLELYLRTGVQEYLTVLIRKREVQWRVMDGGQYGLLKPSRGLLESRVFPELRLDTTALFPPDRARLLAGITSRR